MSSAEDDEDVTEATRIDVFCAHQDDAWRTSLRTGFQPRYLRQHLDEDGEAFPAHFDFEDLDRHMRKHHATLEKHPSAVGGVRMIA